MIKIVISSNTSWNIYNFRLNLARSLKENGYKVILVAPKDKYVEKLKKEFDYYDIYMNNKGTNPIEDLKTIREFYKLYKEIKPNIVLNFTIKPNIYGTIACSLLNIKTINNITGLGTTFIKTNLITKIVKILYQLALKNSYKIFFQNNDDKNIFLENKLVDKKQIDVLPGSGIDTNKFKPIVLERKDNIFRFLLIARMLWDKGIGEYVEAAKIIKQKYKNVEFLLLGAIGVDNPTAISEKKIKKWEKENIIKYLGITDDVISEITKVDCIVLPSYREGTSRVLLESASMAKPIITTNVPGCNNIVEDGLNGYLCEVKNSKDLVDKMEKMLDLTEKQRLEMGKKGLEKIIKEFDEKIVINKYLNVIQKVL